MQKGGIWQDLVRPPLPLSSQCQGFGWHWSASVQPVPTVGWHRSARCRPVPAGRLALRCPVPSFWSRTPVSLASACCTVCIMGSVCSPLGGVGWVG